ncbi:hypothetical protein KAU51_03575 [Candidatus Parcubacteria bacterium]|nr:hypothetical protein [Candidatus Parcubacteria bacterium]
MKITKIKNPKNSYYGGGWKIKMPSGTLTIIKTKIGDWNRLIFPSGFQMEINPEYEGISMKIIPDYGLQEKYNVCCSGSALGNWEFKHMTCQDKKTLSEYMIARWKVFM